MTQCCNYFNDPFINQINLYKIIIPITIATFDIECISSDDDFPQPQKDEDKIIQISTTFRRYGENKCYFKHIITLGTCNPINGFNIESYNDESNVLLAWFNLIRR